MWLYRKVMNPKDADGMANGPICPKTLDRYDILYQNKFWTGLERQQVNLICSSFVNISVLNTQADILFSSMIVVDKK